MPCLKCTAQDLLISAPLTMEEQVGELEAVQNFALCNSCGNVMFVHAEGEFAPTDHIYDENTIRLSYQKLFEGRANKPVAYGYTRDGEQTAIQNDWGGSVLLADTQNQTIEYTDEVVVVDNQQNEQEQFVDLTYSHVDKPELEHKRSLFSKLFNSIKNLFKKAS